MLLAGDDAWRVAPASRVGPLLALSGMALFVGDLATCLDLTPFARACLQVPPLSAAATALSFLWMGFLVHALLTFPTGRVNGRVSLAAVVGVYAVALTPGPWVSGAEVALTVVPAAVWGSHRLFRRVKVAFGPPVDLSDIAPGPRSKRSRDAVDRMMAAIAALIPVAGGPHTEPPGHVDG